MSTSAREFFRSSYDSADYSAVEEDAMCRFAEAFAAQELKELRRPCRAEILHNELKSAEAQLAELKRQLKELRTWKKEHEWRVEARNRRNARSTCDLGATQERDEILMRAWRWDDKPHQLFTYIRQLAIDHPSKDTAEIVRLMDIAVVELSQLAECRKALEQADAAMDFDVTRVMDTAQLEQFREAQRAVETALSSLPPAPGESK